MNKLWKIGVLAISCLPALAGAGETVVDHRLRITADPASGHLDVHDTVLLPPELVKDGITFTLRQGLAIVGNDGTDITPDPAPPVDGVQRYHAAWKGDAPPGERRLTLHYQGTLRQATANTTVTYRGGHPMSSGSIDPEGLLLAGASHWYPDFGQTLLTSEMAVTLPPGWRSLSPGEQAQDKTWRQRQPVDELLLAAAPWVEYRKQGEQATAVVLLREEDPQLAERYLAATLKWLEFYNALLGPAPQPTFTVAENTWESGLGMPGFTLMGSKVLRLPFIPETSLPHEILHAWWGNGVYLDDSQGNWSEGLTTYLADHLIQEQKGKGKVQRRDALQRFSDFTAAGKDFPLIQFRGRQDHLSQSVGYDKGMMFFHALRRDVGDEAFIKGLRAFYAQNRFHRATFADLRHAFEQVLNRSLHALFQQGLERAGAPDLVVAETRLDQGKVILTLEQRQAAPPFALDVPVAVWTEQAPTAWEKTLTMNERRQVFELTPPGKPLMLAVDPRYDLFRRLDPRESPPTLSQAFAASKVMFVMPDSEKEAHAAYRAMATAWGLEARADSELELLPWDGAVWAMGWDNKHKTEIRALLEQYGAQWEGNDLLLGGERFARADHAFVLAGRKQGDDPRTLVWVAAPASALPALTEKLPHYGRESMLIFNIGPEPKLVAKGRWPTREFPMTRALDPARKDIPLKLSPRPPLQPSP